MRGTRSPALRRRFSLARFAARIAAVSVVSLLPATSGNSAEGNAGTGTPTSSPAALAESPSWIGTGGQVDAFYGWSVASAGDVNGDGYDDVVVGAEFYDRTWKSEGAVFVYLGSSTGLSTSHAWSAVGGQKGAAFGSYVDSAGDVNGDGYADVLVGAQLYGDWDQGRAVVYHGSASGLAAAPAWVVDAEQFYTALGRYLASAGDVNGDGYSDVIIAGTYYDNGQTDEGRAYLYLGSPTGLNSTAAWTFESDQSGAMIYAVDCAGDVNADGYSDVIVGSHQFTDDQLEEGRTFVFLGSPAGLSGLPDTIIDGNWRGARSGTSVAGIGDVNGDGFDDVAIGAQARSDDQYAEGRVAVHYGSAEGVLPTPAWHADGDQESANFGHRVTGADFNGDGYSDLAVAAQRWDGGDYDEGGVAVFLGSASGLTSGPTWFGEGGQEGALYGWSVETAGDVNGDGAADLIVGAYRHDEVLRDEGRAYAYYGRPAPAVCGDGRKTRGEECDDGNLVPDDECRNDCTATSCGDGEVNRAEECDGGPGCDADCVVELCGNGKRQAEEQCDDGNDVDGDACGSDCRLPRCGDGKLGPYERCDDGDATLGDGCDPSCLTSLVLRLERVADPDTVELRWSGGPGGFAVQRALAPSWVDRSESRIGETPASAWLDVPPTDAGLLFYRVLRTCGDGSTTAGEVCDDGNNVDADGCRADCSAEVCGDGVLDPNEACDDGGSFGGDGCQPDCRLPRCGDGILDSGEACDDGGAASGDGCRPNCTVERCGDGVRDPLEQCDDGNASDEDACRGDCSLRGNLVTNGDFAGEGAPWVFFTDGAGTFVAHDGVAEIAISAPGTIVQLYQPSLVLDGNALHRLTFRASSTDGADLVVQLLQHGAPFAGYGLSAPVALDASERPFAIEFRTTEGEKSDGRLRFWMSDHDRVGTRYSIRDVFLERLPESP